MITADQIVAHLVGDYILQSDWMAAEKTKRWLPAFLHALAYTLPFLLLSRAPLALAVILSTHLVIDRFCLARYICWVREYLGPGPKPWKDCCKTGYPDEKPAWMSV